MHIRRVLAVTISAAAVAGLAQLSPATGTAPPPDGREAAHEPGRVLARDAAPETLAMRDRAGRVLVGLTPQADADRRAFQRAAERLGLRVTAVDPVLGTLEGYVPDTAIAGLAALPDAGTIVQAQQPFTRSGSAEWQGVPIERVDVVHEAGVTGEGITIGVLSDSFATATGSTDQPLLTTAADDIVSGDLPGPGNPRNDRPVVVIEDGDADDSDEGRAMLQIIHDIAPDATLCFATAFSGLVGFANNIRALADPAGPCAADVIVDDVGYGAEPFFSTGVVATAVEEVAAQGVAYFSSAGNDGDRQGWASEVALVSKAAGVRGTNLDFRGVDPALYAGGLQDMNPGRGVDVALDVTNHGGGSFNLQWNDPVDADGAELGEPVFEATGELTEAAPRATVAFTPTAAQRGRVLITADGVPTGSTDVIVTLVKPDGTRVGPLDVGDQAEKLDAELDQRGTYRIRVSGYRGATGPFAITVEPIVAPSAVTTDFNVLAFLPNGRLWGVFREDNDLTGRPWELPYLEGPTRLQMVVARETTGRTPVTDLRLLTTRGVKLAEYADPAAPTTYGHPATRGAIGVAAYDPYGPFLPEYFTSVGGELETFFDLEGTRYPEPLVDQKPDVAATDRGNTTFFGAPDPRDGDAFPNFSGTSAAAPDAAAVAALMLEQAGGPGTLTPAEIEQRLQESAYGHDLDPLRATGRAGDLRIVAVGAQGDERGSAPGALADPNFFRVSWSGRVPLRSLTFDASTASPTSPRGLVFDPRPLGRIGDYRDGGFPFTVGRVDGVRRGSVTASFDRPTRARSFFRTMTVRFREGLRKGQSVRFGVDRDLAVFAPGYPPVEGNGADELGGAVSFPSGEVLAGGMRFRAVLADGTVLRGAMANRIGAGWSPVDGHGLINAEAAVLGR